MGTLGWAGAVKLRVLRLQLGFGLSGDGRELGWGWLRGTRCSPVRRRAV